MSTKLGFLSDQEMYRAISKDLTPWLKNQLIQVLKECKSQGQINQATYKTIYPTCCSSQILCSTQNPWTGHPKAHFIQQGLYLLWYSKTTSQHPLTTGRRPPPTTSGTASILWSRPSESNFNRENVHPPMMWKPCSYQFWWTLPLTSSMVGYNRTQN